MTRFYPTQILKRLRILKPLCNEAKLKAWGEEMLRIFPDIKKGESLIGVSIPGKGAKFYSREKLIASADDPEFAKAFFDIWLSEKTSEPKLRERLLGSQ